MVTHPRVQSIEDWVAHSSKPLAVCQVHCILKEQIMIPVCCPILQRPVGLSLAYLRPDSGRISNSALLDCCHRWEGCTSLDAPSHLAVLLTTLPAPSSAVYAVRSSPWRRVLSASMRRALTGLSLCISLI